MAKTEKSVLKQAAKDILPSSFLDHKAYLQGLYFEVKNELEGYSYTKFADQLGFGATNIIHQFVKARRPLTTKSGQKIAAALGLMSVEKKYLMSLIEYANAKDNLSREKAMAALLSLKNRVLPDEFDKDCLEFYSKWYHPVVRELVGHSDYQHDADWVSSRIRPEVKPSLIKKSLELLERLSLIKYDDSKMRYVQTNERMTTGHRVKSMAIVQYHKQMIDLAKQALTSVKGKHRDISAVTMSVDQEAAGEIRQMIHEFQIRVLELAENCDDPDNIYHMNIQLFPFTDPSEKKDKP